MAPSRLVRFGVILGVLVACGATISAPREADKAEINNAKARLEAARYVFRARIEGVKVQGSPPDAEKLYLWSRRWLDAEREVSSRKQDQIAAVEAHLGRMKDLEKMFTQLHEAAMVPPYSVAEAKFYRLEAEKYLLDARSK